MCIFTYLYNVGSFRVKLCKFHYFFYFESTDMNVLIGCINLVTQP